VTLTIQPKAHSMGKHVGKVKQQLLIIDQAMASLSRELDQNPVLFVDTVAQRMLIQDVCQGLAARTTRCHYEKHCPSPHHSYLWDQRQGMHMMDEPTGGSFPV
jgi:hypothetical protein